MSRFRSSIPKELLSLGALGVIGIAYAVFASTWHNISFVATMTLLVLIIELFPIRVSKMNFTCSFPVLYTMAITSNYATVVLLSVISIIVSHLIQRRPVRILLLNAATRVIALLATNFVIRGINFLLHIPSHPPIRYYFFNLFVAVVVFSAITYYLVMKYVVRRLSSPSLQPIIFKWSILNIVISYLYVSFMLWLASDPKNTGSGTLGTVFFFIPLVALTIVMHLITGLTRAKSGLETLFTVSQSINQQRDLPTVLRHIISEASRLVHGDCGFLYLVQESGELVRMVGTLDDERVERRHSPGNGLVGTVAQTGEPLMIHDVFADPAGVCRALRPRGRFVLPGALGPAILLGLCPCLHAQDGAVRAAPAR
ncbi:MAG: GAF domain-containing protein, partial [Tumebacillaceae bacterium]